MSRVKKAAGDSVRGRFTRVLIFTVIVIGLAVGYNFVSVHFSGDGKSSPEEALPQDSNYEWIEGPRSEKEVRYFFLYNSGNFGTQVVTKNFKGWSLGSRTSSPLPKVLDENKIATAYSDSEVLFGLIKPGGEVEVTVNGKGTKRIPLTSLSKEVLDRLNVAGYEIWYIDLSELTDSKKFLIKVLDENNSLLNELSI
ncbi:hypothetical protein [Ureibacillus chungkukjangi]|uniref:Uncharacterized protein n=1 Tax=Ureibacillus chungkukjangi TaxID=1202712 RepID=A0A318TU38_9BACL|nr:hypothetical protein [Ureibacillus chungkukjangi]MCM3388373.1 hypothetical protein [Ureibacillus chungkukjangi]PYF07380.1 hypothetical protein BJ095_105170 [Ureibacillus chungkukjangi]